MQPTPTNTTRSTLIGFSSICWWMTFPLLITVTRALPALQSMAVTFTFAFLTNLVIWLARGESPIAKFRAVPKLAWGLGIYGLFGFHLGYYLALRLGPPANMVLIVNLWPVLILVFTGLLLGTRLQWNHWTGVAMGFTGAAIIASQRGEVSLSPSYIEGYCLAFACALIWSSYSVLQRKWSNQIPPGVTGPVSAAVATLCWTCHFIFEETAVFTLHDWLLLAINGIGPIGLAYIAWEHGMRQGDIRVLGSLSFLGPMGGMILLILFGYAPFTAMLVLALLLVLGGAVLGSASLFKKP